MNINSTAVYICQAKGCWGQEDELSFLSCCFAEKKKKAVRLQQWCWEGRWLHSLWSATAVIKSNTLLLTSAVILTFYILFSVLLTVINTLGIFFDGLSMPLMTKWNLVKLSLNFKNWPISLFSFIIIYRCHINMSNVNNFHCLYLSDSTNSSEVVADLFLISPLGCCTRAVHTLL